MVQKVDQADEHQRLVSLADWYFDEQLDFDKKLIRYGYETMKPYFQGPEGLELGSGDGVMTRHLLQNFTRLTVVDGAEKLLASIPDAPNLVKVHTLFEEFAPTQPFNTIVMAHILEHVDDPTAILARAKGWLAPGGRILAIVPNGLSFHRLAAVKMGLLRHSCELNERDNALGHRRVYTPQTFQQDAEGAGLRVTHLSGIFFKPLTNLQMQEHWTDEMIQGFYELGKDFPENAAEIFMVCEIP